MSVVLETQQNNNYEPSEPEIVEYGKWLGMNLPEDNAFLWIAREGLKAPLPSDWKACKSEKGELYYFNFKTGESIWDHPMDEHFKELFKNEKKNPTPQSLANGAKRAGDNEKKKEDTPTSAKKSKKKHSRDREGGDEKQAKSPSRKEDEVHKGKANSLKSLNMKKELPDELKIKFDSVTGKKGKASEIAEQQPTDSSQRLSSVSAATAVPLTLEVADAGALSLIGREEVFATGINGIKALSRLSTPTGAAGSKRLSPVNSPDISEEKERLSQKKEAELALFQKDVDADLRSQKEKIRLEMEDTIREYKAMTSREKETRMTTERARTEEVLQAERAAFETDLSSAIQQLKSELVSQKSVQLQKVRENYQAHMEQEKRKIELEVAEKLESFTREKRQESEIKKEAQFQALSELDSSRSALKQVASDFVHEYEHQYDCFCKTLRRSLSDFALQNIQQKEQLQMEFEKQLNALQQENMATLLRERIKLESDLGQLRGEYSAKIDALKTESEAALLELTESARRNVEEVERAKLACEREALAKTVETLRERQSEEIENLKTELKQKAAEEMKAALLELAKEQKAQLAASLAASAAGVPASVEAVPDGKANPSVGKEDLMGESQMAKAISSRRMTASSLPPLDDGLLQARTSSELARFYEGVASQQHLYTQSQPDIKSLITEALHEVFSGSPFILPSPSMGGRVESPFVQRTHPKRMSEVTNFDTGAGRGFSMSFQDQQALVDSERHRVQEGRRFADSLRRSLEGRRQQLKITRHQWKQDVLAAKQEGVRSSSKRGQHLNNVRVSLEEQAQRLEQDESTLRDSELWLLAKEQRLMQMEQQIAEQEQMRSSHGSNDAMTHSNFDISALATGYFTFPQHRRSQPSISIPSFAPLDSPTTSPLLSKALGRIEKRLDEVTSIMNMQQMGSLPSPSRCSAVAGAPTSLKASSQSRRKNSRSQSKTDMKGETVHVDPWQT